MMMEAATEIIMYRRPRENDKDKDNQVFVFHSPIERIDQQLVVYRNPNDFVVFKREYVIFSKLPDYNDPSKRHFLNECIHLVYVMHRLGHKITFDEAATVQCGRDELKQLLDNYIRTECSPWDYKIFKCKRQLFRESNQVRKQKRVRRNPYFGITLEMHAKPVRHLIERLHIRRGFLKPVREIAMNLMMRETLVALKIRSQQGIRFFAELPKLPPWIPTPLRASSFT